MRLCQDPHANKVNNQKNIFTWRKTFINPKKKDQDVRTVRLDENRAFQKKTDSGPLVGSVSSRECLDAPAILATFTAGRTALVACP